MFYLVSYFVNPLLGFILQLTWERLNMVPGAEELLGSLLEEDSRLKAVRLREPYASVEEYMDIYFRLLRTDCFASIQKVSAVL